MSLAPAASNAVALLTKDEALVLTAKIKGYVGEAWRMLHQAHEGRAWAALGYPSWEAYVRAEFDLSRSHSYALLDQAHVIAELEAAAGMSGAPDISGRDARDIKPRLAEVVDAVRDAVVDVPPQDRPAIVRDEVEKARRTPPAERDEAAVLLERRARNSNSLATAVQWAVMVLATPAGRAGQVDLYDFDLSRHPFQVTAAAISQAAENLAAFAEEWSDAE